MSVLVARKAPNIIGAAVLGNGKIVEQFNLFEDLKKNNSYAIVFFYPLNFTFVCPSELIALDKRMPEFNSKNVVVIGISIDSQFSHNTWRNTAVEKGGIGPVAYTLIADTNHSICQAYGIEHPEAGIALRAAFLIDQSGIVRSQIVNDLPLGRNIDELLRLVDALQYHEAHGEVCPAGWKKGDKAMDATPSGVADFLATYAEQL